MKKQLVFLLTIISFLLNPFFIQSQIRIAILPFQDKTDERAYSGLAEKLYDAIKEIYVNNGQGAVEVISRDQLQAILKEQNLSLSDDFDVSSAAGAGKLLGVKQIIIGKITDVIYTPASTDSKNKDFKDKVKTGQKEQYKDKKGKIKTRNVETPIYATATKYTKKTSAMITATLEIIDVETGKTLQTISAKDRMAAWEHEWVTYNGDKRALSDKYKDLAKKNDKNAPVKEIIINNALQNVIIELRSQIRFGY